MRVYGTHGDIQLSGYLFRCQTLAAEFHDFKLPARHLRNVFHRLDVIDDFLQLFRLGVVRNRGNKVIVEDDAGNKLTCDVKVLPPRVFSSGDELRVEDDRKSRVDFGHTALFGIVSSSNKVRSVSGWVSFDITNLENICDVQRKGPKTGESELYYKCKIDNFILTGKRKGSVEVTATDENGNVRKAKVSSGEFHFEDDSEICFSVLTPLQSSSDKWYDSHYIYNRSREDKVDVINSAHAFLKVSKGRSGINY